MRGGPAVALVLVGAVAVALWVFSHPRAEVGSLADSARPGAGNEAPRAAHLTPIAPSASVTAGLAPAPHDRPPPPAPAVPAQRGVAEALAGYLAGDDSGLILDMFIRERLLKERSSGAACRLVLESLAGLDWTRITPWHDGPVIDRAAAVAGLLAGSDPNREQMLYAAIDHAWAAYPHDRARLALARIAMRLRVGRWDERATATMGVTGQGALRAAVARVAGDGSLNSQAWLMERHREGSQDHAARAFEAVLLETVPIAQSLPRVLALVAAPLADGSPPEGHNRMAQSELVHAALVRDREATLRALAHAWSHLGPGARIDALPSIWMGRESAGGGAAWKEVLRSTRAETSEGVVIRLIEVTGSQLGDPEIARAVLNLAARADLSDGMRVAVAHRIAEGRRLYPGVWRD